MLGGGNDVILVEESCALAFQARDHGASIGGDDFRIFGIAFIAAAPAVVARHGDGRGEGPVHTGRTDFLGGGATDPLDQGRIVGGAQADIVRKQRRAVDIVVAVDSVRRPDQRDRGLLARPYRHLIIGLDQIDPILDGGMLVAARDRAAAVFDRADMILRDFLGLDRLPFRLDDLADLFFNRHGGNDFRDTRFHGGVETDRRLGLWPKRRVHGGGGQ